MLDVPEHERFCTHCSKAMCLIGVDVSERGQMIPAQIVVNRYERRKYGCPDGHCVVTANAPDGVIEGAKYEASVYAWLATAKYSDHLPLNRLEGILKPQGVHLPKQTMWDMLVRLDELVAQPVLRQMRIELQEEPVLHADETPIARRLEDGKGSRTGYAFGWRNLRESEESKGLVEFKTSRSRDGPSSFLGKWKGTLIVDRYGGYDEVVANNGITRAGCWSHARRKLKEALDCGARAAATFGPRPASVSAGTSRARPCAARWVGSRRASRASCQGSAGQVHLQFGQAGPVKSAGKSCVGYSARQPLRAWKSA